MKPGSNALTRATTFLLLLLAPSLTARAAGMASFRLTNLDSAGAAPVQEVLALVLPTGSVAARDVDRDPPTILPASTGYVSSGFDAAALLVSLGEGLIEKTDGSADPFQALKLDFGPDGFGPGGRLYFQLKWSSSYDPDLGLIRLMLPTDVTNLAVETIDVSPTGLLPPTGPVVPETIVPEPATWAGWSLALLALAARRQRRKCLA